MSSEPVYSDVIVAWRQGLSAQSQQRTTLAASLGTLYMANKHRTRRKQNPRVTAWQPSYVKKSRRCGAVMAIDILNESCQANTTADLRLQFETTCIHFAAPDLLMKRSQQSGLPPKFMKCFPASTYMCFLSQHRGIRRVWPPTVGESLSQTKCSNSRLRSRICSKI